MVRTGQRILFLFIAALAAFGGCSYRNEKAIRDRDVEAKRVVSVHERIDHTVKYVKHSTGMTDDGRMTIQVVVSSKKGSDLAVIMTTQWYDENGAVVEQSTPRPVVLPSGAATVFEDACYSTKAVDFNVQIRPMETRRKS